ncbi:MAG: Gfo/Idh/MocA family oxidoreductase [Solirubrobacteraceae bacterium]
MPIDIALLGCGHPHIADVLGVIVAEPDLRLAAAWDADPSGVPGEISSHRVADIETAIRRADAVVVCAPTDQRPGVCVRAAASGRPILVEKPLARTAAEGRAAAREITRSRTPAYPALFLRELPALGRLRGVLRAGLLGRPSAATASYLHAGALNGSLAGARAWMRNPQRAGVGGLGDLAIHLVDAFAALGAVPRLDAISLDRGPVGSTDVGGTALGRWGDVPFSLSTSWVTRPAGLEIIVHGSAASAVLRDGSLDVVTENGSRERWVGAPPDAGEALRSFVGRLRTRRLALDQLAGAIRAQEIIERATRLE